MSEGRPYDASLPTVAAPKRVRVRTLALVCLASVAIVLFPSPVSSGSIWDRRGMEPYSLPLGRVWLSRDVIVRPHHDHPATDINVPSGTPAYSVQAGRVVAILHNRGCGLGVVIDGVDGFRYTYCHGSQALVSGGRDVRSGQKVMRTGNSGSSGRPHLHLEIEDARMRLRCPQPLILSWWKGGQTTPRAAPYGGCSY